MRIPNQASIKWCSTSAGFRHGDYDIVTPFAQLLASLRNVRANLYQISQFPSPIASSTNALSGSTEQEKLRNRRSTASGSAGYPQTPTFTLHSSEAVQQCAQETLEEMDWCLEQLEMIHVHRSITEMASSKFRSACAFCGSVNCFTMYFRKLLNKELSQFAESSGKAGSQISKFITSTYMEVRHMNLSRLKH